MAFGGYGITKKNLIKVKIEKALVNVESTYAMGEYSSITVYQGVKRDLETKLKMITIQIESSQAELEHLNDKDSWLEWLDELAVVMNDSAELSPMQKRKFLKLILRRIDVSHEASTNLHRLKINFRLPLLTDLGGVVKHNLAIRRNIENKAMYFQTAGSTDNTGAPDISRTLHSTVTNKHSSASVVGKKGGTSNHFFLCLSIEYTSATLWTAPYSDYQQFLYDTIDQMHKDGNSYIKISQWMNDNDHLTPRGSVFKPNHAWSIHKKKRKSIERFARVFEPEITNIGIDIAKL